MNLYGWHRSFYLHIKHLCLNLSKFFFRLAGTTGGIRPSPPHKSLCPTHTIYYTTTPLHHTNALFHYQCVSLVPYTLAMLNLHNHLTHRDYICSLFHRNAPARRATYHFWFYHISVESVEPAPAVDAWPIVPHSPENLTTDFSLEFFFIYCAFVRVTFQMLTISIPLIRSTEAKLTILTPPHCGL